MMPPDKSNVYAASEVSEWNLSGGGGGGGFAYLHYAADKSPDVESKCSESGQGCSGKRGGHCAPGIHITCGDAGAAIGAGIAAAVGADLCHRAEISGA
jgi:hypothetical protein